MRPELEHPHGLCEDRAGGARLGKGEMGARELKPHLDRDPGNAVVKLRSQTMCPCQRRARVLASRLVDGNACCRRARECARRVVAEARLCDERFCRPRALPCLAPSSSLGCEESELRLRQVDLFGTADGLPAFEGC